MTWSSRSTTVPLVALVALLLLAPGPAQAQENFTLSGIGGRVGITEPEDGDTAFTAIFHLEFMRPGTQWHISPEVRYWSEDVVSDLNPNLNVFYHFAESGRASPYVGAGVGIHIYDVDIEGVDGENDLGMNLIGGLLIPVGANAHLFAEGRYVVSDLEQLDVLAGLTVPLAGH